MTAARCCSTRECSVIANNFILRPTDEAHIEEVYRLLRSSPDEIRKQRPDVKYVLLRARDFMRYARR